MGFLSKIFKKITRTVKKPLSKVFKGVAKGIAKVGKAVMRGVNYVNRKLGPIGAIGLAIAMPYAMQGLSAGTTGLMNSNNLFLKAIGNVGNSIRLGYQATTGHISTAFNSISKTIAKSFQNFAGKGTKLGNYWTRVSDGAKTLYKSARSNFANTFGKQATAGTVNVTAPGFGHPIMGSGTAELSLLDAAKYVGQEGVSFSGQTAGSQSGWWTKELSKTQLNNQKLISNTINEAWNNTHQLSGNALKYKNDLITQAKDIGSYINDEQIGNLMFENGATTNELLTGKNYIDVDLAATGDYTLGSARDRVAGTYNFNGNKSFNTKIAKNSKVAKKLKSYAFSKADSLLASKMPEHPVVYEVDTADQNLYTDSSTKYSGTDITGASGGDLFAAVFGNANANNIKNYYKNMNILAG